MLYEPSINSINRILEVASMGFSIIILDNSCKIEKRLLAVNNVNYYHFEKNIGLSGGINFITKKAFDLGYLALLNFDQDTVFTRKTLDFVYDVFFNYVINEKFGRNLICLSFRDLINNNSREFIQINSEIYRIDEVDFTINSGSLYILKFYNKFIWFSNNYFVDGLDYFFCLSANKYGYKIMECYSTPDLNHSIEQDDQSFHFLCFKFTGRKYSISRNIEFLKSHFRLIFQTIFNLQFRQFFFLIKSLIVYILSQFFFTLKNILA